MNWHLRTAEEVVEHFGSASEGISSQEAERRQQKYGPNLLTEKKRKPAWLMLLAQFKDVMILILLAAAIISGLAGDAQDAVVILVIVVLNAVVGFVQEYRAEEAMAALKKIAISTAKVKRDGSIQHVSSADLVPGDIVLLEAGDMVPADLRLIKSFGLKVEEASLTGESHPVTKTTRPIPEEHTPLAERTNMAYKSTLVTSGRGTGIVVATGMQTEIGAIAQMLQEEEVKTPLQKRLADFSAKLSIAILSLCAVLYVVGLIRGEDPVRMLLTAISLAVAAVPEALPAVITIALALGAKKMVRKQALIRNLPAVETLGSVTFICSDKTGTLTQNRMTVKETWIYRDHKPHLPSLNHDQVLTLCMSLNHDTKRDEQHAIKGDPTEVAIVEHVHRQPEFNAEWEQQYPRVHELTFDADRKMMTTVHEMGERYLVITKGALESVLPICPHANADVIHEEAKSMASTGQRTLAYAYKVINNLPENASFHELESDLAFCGFVGMIDPPRSEVLQAVTECKTAGIVPVMITGDHPETAKAIARELGILENHNDRVITGSELAVLDQDTFEEEVFHYKVYARVSPEQKLRIVKTLQAKDQFVAVTGDGVNDAPALKRGNIGIAMGIMGTDVSKEASDMILLDDNFATIVGAVKEGRRIFDNIRRFIKYVLTGNSAEILTIFLAPLVGLPIPLLPIHILWINLVTDGLPGLALAGEAAEKNIMERPPRKPDESIFAHGLGVHILWVGLFMAALTLGTQAWAMQMNKEHWQTMVFTVLCLGQMAHVLAIRSESNLLYRHGFLGNIPLIGAVLLTFLLQLALIYIPSMNTIFSTHPLTLTELLGCVVVSSLVFHAVEIEKIVRKRRSRLIEP